MNPRNEKQVREILTHGEGLKPRQTPEDSLLACASEMYALLDEINAAFYCRTSRKEWIEVMAKTKPLLQKARGL